MSNTNNTKGNVKTIGSDDSKMLKNNGIGPIKNTLKNANSSPKNTIPKRSKKIENKIKSAKRLIETCEREIFKGEYGLFTIRGVENLSRSDIDTIIMYCEYFIKNKTIGGLMTPRGNIAEVLKKIEILESSEDWLY